MEWNIASGSRSLRPLNSYRQTPCYRQTIPNSYSEWQLIQSQLWAYGDAPVVLYSTVQYSTVQYNTIQYNTVQYSTIQYNTIQYNTVQYSTVQYSTVQYTRFWNLEKKFDSWMNQIYLITGQK